MPRALRCSSLALHSSKVMRRSGCSGTSRACCSSLPDPSRPKTLDSTSMDTNGSTAKSSAAREVACMPHYWTGRTEEKTNGPSVPSPVHVHDVEHSHPLTHMITSNVVVLLGLVALAYGSVAQQLRPARLLAAVRTDTSKLPQVRQVPNATVALLPPQPAYTTAPRLVGVDEATARLLQLSGDPNAWATWLDGTHPDPVSADSSLPFRAMLISSSLSSLTTGVLRALVWRPPVWLMGRPARGWARSQHR